MSSDTAYSTKLKSQHGNAVSHKYGEKVVTSTKKRKSDVLRRVTEKPAKRQKTQSASVLALSKSITDVMVKVESKEPVAPFKGTSAPVDLKPPYRGYELIPTKESAILRTAMSRMFAGKQYPFRITTALNMSSTATGGVNSVIGNNTLGTTADFASLAGVFNEFFVVKYEVSWEPVSMYNYPITPGVTVPPSATVVSSLPIGCADLQHGLAAYTNLTNATENYRFQYHNTGRPFKYSWVNTEDKASTVNPSSGSSTTSTQSWADVNDVSMYTGTLQFIAQSAPPALPTTQVLGTFLVEWLVYFRVRS